MAMQKFAAADILGLTPAVEPTSAEGKTFALDGANFVFDTRGPRSSFGNRTLSQRRFSLPSYVQSKRLRTHLGMQVFYFFGDGIYEWHESLGHYSLVYQTPDTTKYPFRWSCDYLTGLIYFCHPRTGILVYNPDTQVCLPHAQIGKATPNGVQCIAVNNGRLCAMDPLYFTWSNPGDGTDFTPGLGGGGFQLISDRMSGIPITMTTYTGGCLTWTTAGTMRSVFTGDAAVFQHRSLTTEFMPVSSFGTTRVDNDTVILLDERGLFQSRGQNPTLYTPPGESSTAYAPMFNEFLIQYIRENQLSVRDNVRLEWDELRKFLYLSVNIGESGALFQKAFVFYPQLDKWGSFDEPHYGIGPVRIDDSTRMGNYYGYVDVEGVQRYWVDAASREVSASKTQVYVSANYWNPPNQKPTQYQSTDDGRIACASGRLSGFSKAGMNQREGYYSPGILTPIVPEITGLNSFITAGFFRPVGPNAVDEMAEVVNILIRSSPLSPSSIEVVDYMQGTGADDWNADVGTQDFGLDVPTSNIYQLTVTGTLDGTTEFMSETPMLASFNPTAQYYACSVTGVWHSVTIGAANPGDSFHLKMLELTATSAGRIL